MIDDAIEKHVAANGQVRKRPNYGSMAIVPNLRLSAYQVDFT